MSAFDRLAALTATAITGNMGESALLLPRVTSQYTARASDPDRDAALVVGVFEAGPEREDVSGRRPPNQFRASTRMATMEAAFWLSAEQAGALPWRPRPGDALQLTARAGQPVYAIAALDPTDLGDLTLVLVVEDQP